MGHIRPRTKSIRDFIINHIPSNSENIVRLTAGKFSITRQAVNRHIRSLEKEGIIIGEGHARSRTYSLVDSEILFEIVDLNESISEDILWREKVVARIAGNDLSRNVVNVCQHGFTEMVNNVIDHSESKRLEFSVSLNAISITIKIFDFGVGIFNKIANYFNLDIRQAMLELSKGKLTTDPSHHTGEGIFFTSKMFNEFTISSGPYFFSKDFDDEQWLLEIDHAIEGTLVTMEIKRNSKMTTRSVFEKYTSSENGMAFNKTHIPVRLAQYEGEALVSRSQARRLLARFEQFDEVLLDFEGVKEIGPAFADEIFRVYKNENPKIKITRIHANKKVESMILRALESH